MRVGGGGEMGGFSVGQKSKPGVGRKGKSEFCVVSASDLFSGGREKNVLGQARA